MVGCRCPRAGAGGRHRGDLCVGKIDRVGARHCARAADRLGGGGVDGRPSRRRPGPRRSTRLVLRRLDRGGRLRRAGRRPARPRPLLRLALDGAAGERAVQSGRRAHHEVHRRSAPPGRAVGRDLGARPGVPVGARLHLHGGGCGHLRARLTAVPFPKRGRRLGRVPQHSCAGVGLPPPSSSPPHASCSVSIGSATWWPASSWAVSSASPWPAAAPSTTVPPRGVDTCRRARRGKPYRMVWLDMARYGLVRACSAPTPRMTPRTTRAWSARP